MEKPANDFKRKRLFLLDEMIESCRLMPTWVQSILFTIFFIIVALFFPIVPYFFFETIIVVQVVFLLLLIKKNIVYKRISRMQIALKKKVIWVYTKEDHREKKIKGLVNFVFLILTLVIFHSLDDYKLLIINALFCLIFFCKFIFYVPLVSLRIIEEENKVEKFVVIDKGLRINTEIYLSQIKWVEINSNEIKIKTKLNTIEIPLNFNSKEEFEKLKRFLIILNKFEVK